MKTQFDINKVVKNGKIQSELELERALIADRKLRILAKEDPHFKEVRGKLRDLIEEYENRNWSKNSDISESKIKESDIVEAIAEQERIFLQKRKEIIKNKMKDFGINQMQLGLLLGHRSKSYISELINGLSPFSLKDLIIINRLLKIDLQDLVPAFLSYRDRIKIKSSVEKLDNPKLKIAQSDFEFV